MIPISAPLIGDEERAAVLEVLASGHLAEGERVRAFEEAFAAYCGVRYAVAVSSGTAALMVALAAHGIGPGDEVITTPFSFIATANAIQFVGARPVFVDVREEDFNLDPEQVEARITPRTRALLPVHLYGQPCDLEPLLELCRRHGLALIEDACQAHGARYRGRRVGSFGTGCFSFYPTKNMTTGEGGIITTNDEEVAERARLFRNHGSRRRYHHETLGYNFRMTDLAAAIGLVQLRHLDAWTEARRRNAAYLQAHLRAVTVPQELPGRYHVYHQFTVRVPDVRDRLVEKLAEDGIGCGVYYPVPIHRQPVYRALGYEDVLPVAERLAGEVLSLPVHPRLTAQDLDRIAAAVERHAGA